MHPESCLNADLYQLTSLIVHYDNQRAEQKMTMSFFVRSMPAGQSYLVWAGLRRCMNFLMSARFSEADIQCLLVHPSLKGLVARRALQERLRGWKFDGTVRGLPEGSFLFADRDEEFSVYTPIMEVTADLLTLKLIETPLLSIMNHMIGVATCANEVVEAAQGIPVLEAGQRRTAKDSSADASYAAYIGGCMATSNVAAYVKYGVPVMGTMDHFAVQACEREGLLRHDSEADFFRQFLEVYPDNCSLLVDTYDTFGEHTGIRNAVRVAGDRLKSIRLDSNITSLNIYRARELLNTLGAVQAKIVVSGGLNKEIIKDLRDANAPVDMFLVGENISCATAIPVVGVTAKICAIGDAPSMKLAGGGSKATLPGPCQIFTDEDNVKVVGFSCEHWQPGDEFQTLYENGFFFNRFAEPNQARAIVMKNRNTITGVGVPKVRMTATMKATVRSLIEKGKV